VFVRNICMAFDAYLPQRSTAAAHDLLAPLRLERSPCLTLRADSASLPPHTVLLV
jgi:hypothetical protein